MISKKGKELLGESSPLVVAHFKCKQDPFSLEHNPDGKINFGTAENHLMDKQMLKAFERPIKYSSQDLHYGHLHGTISFRKAIASFMDEFIHIKDVNYENIVIASGASAILESLSMAMFENNEGLVVPTPFYTGFIHDFSTRFNVKIIPLHLRAKDNFNLNPEDIFKLVTKAKKDGIKIKAILVCSPHNPLGITYPETVLRQIVTVAQKLNLEIIADEIYAKSVYKESFTSMLEIGRNYREHIHFVYGFAKDFVLSGLKTGVFYSENKDLVRVMQEIAYFHTVSNHTQKFIESLLLDKNWCSNFIIENNTKLLETYFYFKNLFKEELDIKIIEANAGIFIWADFSKYLTDHTFESELLLFDQIFNTCGISITPGQFFKCSDPGWFRVCFAQDKSFITAAVNRLKEHLL